MLGQSGTLGYRCGNTSIAASSESKEPFWAMQCRLEPVNESTRHGQGTSLGDHQYHCVEGQQRSGGRSQHLDQDDKGEEQGIS